MKTIYLSSFSSSHLHIHTCNQARRWRCCCCCCRCCQKGKRRWKEIIRNIYWRIDRKRNIHRVMINQTWHVHIYTYICVCIILYESLSLHLVYVYFFSPPFLPFFLKHRWWLTMLPQLIFASIVRSIRIISKHSKTI